MWTYITIIFFWVVYTASMFGIGKYVNGCISLAIGIGLFYIAIKMGPPRNYNSRAASNTDDNDGNYYDNEDCDDNKEHFGNNSWTNTKYPDEDDSYDGFHMQREEEYRQEFGDDYEDAIEDDWSNKRRR